MGQTGGLDLVYLVWGKLGIRFSGSSVGQTGGLYLADLVNK